ncbi:MAG: dihydrolipoamide acetyltransferase family protein [Phycisphaerales bacterium JB037]
MAGKVSSDPNIFLLPDIGEGLQEAEVIKWLVKPGDVVEENQTLAEVQTDKALTEIPSPRAGTIAVVHGKDGDIMPVGEPFVSYVADDGSTPAANTATKTAPKPAEKAQAKLPDSDDDIPGDTDEAREDAGTVVGQVGGQSFNAQPGKALATPAVRRLARDLGVNIDAVRGSGIGGRVLDRDVRDAAESGYASSAPTARTGAQATPAPQPAPARPAATAPRAAAPAQQPQIPQGQDTARIPIRDVRRIIGQRLRQSVDNAVHFTVMDEADVTELDSLRKQIAAASGEKVSFLPFVCSAVARVLTGQFGALNATTDDANSEIIQHRSVHLGIATDTDNGLMVPVIRDADRLGVLELSRHVAHVATAARNRTAPRDMLSGSTFTISNVGSYAGRFATPVINYPEVGILAVGRTTEGMVVKNGWFKVGKLMPLSLACDHRVVDGATAALALAEIVRLLENPSGLLTPAR